jgi:hypothetical protein
MLKKTTLSPKEHARYKACTEQILQSIQAQFDGGIALIEVQEQKLYRDDFDTFEDYCSTILGISRTRAYQLIEAAQVKESLPEKAGEKIVNESQARALSDVPENMRAKVIREAEKTGSITADSLRQASSEMSKIVDTKCTMKSGVSLKTPIELDECGTPIPKDALPYWHRRQEVQDLMTQITRVKSAIEKAKSEADNLYGIVSNAVLADLSKAYAHLSEAKPYAVCTQCMGSPSVQPKGDCSLCRGSGLISKYKWDTVSRKEVKEIRLKSNALRV